MTGGSVDVEGNIQVVAFVPLDPRHPAKGGETGVARMTRVGLMHSGNVKVVAFVPLDPRRPSCPRLRRGQQVRRE